MYKAFLRTVLLLYGGLDLTPFYGTLNHVTDDEINQPTDENVLIG